jgi:hypothetical protein
MTLDSATVEEELSKNRNQSAKENERVRIATDAIPSSPFAVPSFDTFFLLCCVMSVCIVQREVRLLA